MAAGYAAKDSVLVLQAHQVVAIEVQELSSTFVGSEILLSNLNANLFRVVVARIRIVHWYCEQTASTKFGRHSTAQVCRKCGYSALPRPVVPDDGNSCGEGQCF